MTTHLPTRTALPWWRRFLFGMLLPMLACYGAYVWFHDRLHAALPSFSIPAPRGAVANDLAHVLSAYAPFLGVIVTLPVWMFLLLFTLRRWQHWYTALVGGILMIAFGLAITWRATLLMSALLR